MEKKILMLLLVVAVIFSGCATGYVGKTFPTDKMGRLSGPSKTIIFEGGDSVIYHVAYKKLIGKLVFAERPGSQGNEFVRLVLTAWFADGNGLISTKSSYSWDRNDNVSMDEELNFTIDIPQDYTNLEYVLFSYQGNYIN